jgi:protein-tyrosine phosphatase
MVSAEICLQSRRVLLVIDIHSHILAEVDDGPKSWDTAVEMCRMSADDGVEYMVATPHANDRYHYDREYLAGALQHLRSLIGNKLRVGLGCDFHFSYDNLQDALVRPQRYTIEQTNYLLVELSNYSVPPQVTESLMRLREKDLTPILTHPERNPILQKSMHRVLDWVQSGVVVQVTASALTGLWGELVRQSAEWLLRQQAVHVLASDAHDTKQRVPGLSKARAAAATIVGEEIAKALVNDNPRAIVNNQELPYFPRPTLK